MTAVTKAVQAARQGITQTQEERELRKAEHGRQVHEACYKYGHLEPLTLQELEELKQLPILVQQAVAEYRRLMHTDPELRGISIGGYETKLRGYIGGRYFSGSADITCRLNGSILTIIDIKTESATHNDGTVRKALRAQVTAYAEFAERMWGIKVHKLLIIELQPGHKGRVLVVPRLTAEELTQYIARNPDEIEL